MAKRATSKPVKATKPAAAPTLSPGVSCVPPPVETPPEVLGVLPPVAPLSKVVVTDAAGDAYDEGDIPPEIVVGSESSGSADEPPADLLEALPMDEAADAPKLDATHPAIALAQRYQAGSGKTNKRPGRYYTPEPPKLR